MRLRHLELREGGPGIEGLELSDDEALALEASALASVVRPPGQRGWRVSPGSKVGAVRVGRNLQVTVHPKVPVARLLFLMGYVRDPRFWHEELAELDAHPELMSALADVYAHLAANAVGRGLVQGYRTVEESLPVMRGRLRVAEQIRAHGGVSLPLEVTYDEFTVDVPENQILLAAAVRLLRTPGITTAARRQIQRLRIALADVTLAEDVPPWQPSRLNQRYVPALRLAELILALDSVDLTVGTSRVRVTGFSLDLWSVYEAFVCTALGRALERFGGRATSQFRTHLDSGSTVPLRPDLVWERGGRVQVVVDAKYKETRLDRFPNADLYQLLAYCTALRRQHGHLVYAQGEGAVRAFEVREAGITIHCHTLDLSQPPAGLLEQIDRLAARLARPV